MQADKIIDFFFEVGSLRKVMRSHRQTLLTDDLTDNISSHSYRVTMIGWVLAKMEKADLPKVLQMCLLHDLPESRSGDQNWVNKKYLKVYEEEIMKDQFNFLPDKKDFENIAKEYADRKSLEARVTKDADLLDQIMLLREYEWLGNQEAVSWLRGKEQEKRLFTKSAKKLAKIIYTQKPSSWWNKIWTAERR